MFENLNNKIPEWKQERSSISSICRFFWESEEKLSVDSEFISSNESEESEFRIDLN